MEFEGRGLDCQFGDKEEYCGDNEQVKGVGGGLFGSCLLQIGMTDMSGHPDNLQLEDGLCMQERIEFELGFSFNQELKVSGFRAGRVPEKASVRFEASFDSMVPTE